MKLDKRDIKFFSKNLKDAALLKKFEVCLSDEIDKQTYTLLFIEEELDMLDNELSRILWEIGVDENDEVNAQGRYIEHLIDLVYNEYNQ